MRKRHTPTRHVVFDLNEFGVAVMEQNLRRAHPDYPDAEIARELRDWQLSRPHSLLGDASGVPSRRFDAA